MTGAARLVDTSDILSGMSAVRSRRWTVEVSVAGERREWPPTKDPVEAVWIHYWQRAGSEAVEVESVDLWAEPWGDPVAGLMPLDLRDKSPDWLKLLIEEHRPGRIKPVVEYAVQFKAGGLTWTDQRWERVNDQGEPLTEEEARAELERERDTVVPEHRSLLRLARREIRTEVVAE